MTTDKKAVVAALDSLIERDHAVTEMLRTWMSREGLFHMYVDTCPDDTMFADGLEALKDIIETSKG